MPARAGWKVCKDQMSKTLGADWAKKTFTKDLGPSFDKIEKNCSDFRALANTVDKDIAKLLEMAKAIHSEHGDISDILQHYGLAVMVKAKEKKVTADWDGLSRKLTESYRLIHNPSLHKLAKAGQELSKVYTPIM